MESLNGQEGGHGKLNVAVVVGSKVRAEKNDGNSKRGLASANDETRGQFMLSDLDNTSNTYIQIIVILNHRWACLQPMKSKSGWKIIGLGLNTNSAKLTSLTLAGATPPSVFVGRYGYPKVKVGPMVPPIHGDTTILDKPEMWLGKSIEDIVNYRLSLVRGNKPSETSYP